MARGRNTRPNAERRIDIEGGVVPEPVNLKNAAEVAVDTLDEATRTRLENDLADHARDSNTALTRATRDRDRATPRDTTPAEMSSRLRHDLPAPTEYRPGISPRQRKLRSATKNRVMAAAFPAQTEAIESLFGEGVDPVRRRSIQAQLHAASGNVQLLDPGDRKIVQRIDRAVQSYERANDRDHTVYFSVKMPETVDPIINSEDLPSTMQIGERVTLDQFTVAAHDPAELPGHGTDDQDYVIVELVTNRGLYMGRSDTVTDSTHLLPRGLDLEFVAADRAPFAGANGTVQDRLIVQARERKPVVEVEPGT